MISGQKPEVMTTKFMGVRSHPVIQFKYKIKDYKVDDIYKDIPRVFELLAKSKSKDGDIFKKMKANGYEVMLSMDLEILRHRGGKWFKTGEPVKTYYDLDDYDGVIEKQDKIDEFILYFRPPKSRAGGCDGEMNDCLFDNCIRPVFYKVHDMPRQYNTPEKLKEALKLGRKDLIPVSYLPNDGRCSLPPQLSVINIPLCHRSNVRHYSIL